MTAALLREELRGTGLNAFGVADVGAWDAAAGPERQSQVLLPGTTSILVVGSGGRELWQAMLADLRDHPDRLANEAHPLDAFVERQVRKADAALPGGVPRRWFFAAATAEVHLDFRALAHLAGLGRRSRLGLLLHPEYGVWLGLRAACFLASPQAAGAAATGPVAGDPCAGCAAPCIPACPGEAFVEGHWNVDRCSAFHAAAPTCSASCAARSACIVAPEHRYDADAYRYHYDRATGRARLRELVGLSEAGDQYEGVGPHWQTWRRKVRVHDERGA
jgi:epoxyqueuosine reductase QueG